MYCRASSARQWRTTIVQIGPASTEASARTAGVCVPSATLGHVVSSCNKRIDRPVEMRLNARQKHRNFRYAITYVIWANQKTESFEHHWLHAIVMLMSELSRHFVGHRTSFQVLSIRGY